MALIFKLYNALLICISIYFVGPHEWFKFYPQANGTRQSPVDINTTTCKKVKVYQPLKWYYVTEESKSLTNPGYCWRVDVQSTESILTGGPMDNNIYKLVQFHCHWGCENNIGSEHTVNGESYAGELHLVHWNSTKYESFEEAASASDGLAVLGIFLKPGSHNNEMEKISNLLKFIQHKGDRVTLPNGCNPAEFIPNSTEYWTYEGSLTTPPCSESVIWIVFKNPIEISQEQLEAMRDLNSYDIRDERPCNELNGKVINNFRPPLPLGNRDLCESVEC